MTSNELFNKLLEEPVLIEKYGLKEKHLKKITLTTKGDLQIIEALKLIIQGVEYANPNVSIYKQIKTQFNLK